MPTHDGFDDIVQKAYRAQVIMVSPSLLMLAIQVVQQIQKDARMREAADLIRTEVGHLMKDVSPRRPRPQAADALRPGQRGHRHHPDLSQRIEKRVAISRSLSLMATSRRPAMSSPGRCANSSGRVNSHLYTQDVVMLCSVIPDAAKWLPEIHNPSANVTHTGVMGSGFARSARVPE